MFHSLAKGRLRVDELKPAHPVAAMEVDDVKETVREWYDRLGWQTNEQGCCNDTASLSDATATGHGLYALMSQLSILDRFSSHSARSPSLYF